MIYSHMLTSENAANLTRLSTNDNQLEDGGKTHVTHVEKFRGQPVFIDSSVFKRLEKHVKI